jgi:hypothetical protein
MLRQLFKNLEIENISLNKNLIFLLGSIILIIYFENRGSFIFNNIYIEYKY